MKYRLEVVQEYEIEENGYIDAIMDFIEILKKGTYDLKVKCLFKEEKGEEKEDSDMGLLIYENKAMAHYLKKLGLDIDDIIFKYKEK